MTAENAVTDKFLASLPLRAQFKARMTELYDYERFGVPEKKGGRYFYTSMGAPEDFKDENFRRLLTNAILWTSRRDPEAMRK